MKIYIDESGDLGFKFSTTHKGSSKYFVACGIALPDSGLKAFRRIVTRYYGKYSIDRSHEVKGTQIINDRWAYIEEQILNFKHFQKQAKVVAIVIDKRNFKSSQPSKYIDKESTRHSKVVTKTYRKVNNLVYHKALIETIFNLLTQQQQDYHILIDQKTTKQRSANTIINSVMMRRWFDTQLKGKFRLDRLESHRRNSLILTDWLTHAVWKKYEHRTQHFVNSGKIYDKIIEI